ncbi:MAG: hypothetical protein IH591_19355, partial [Bacteroidales bacterium]|nr:hypothetical protein [Bacteroidales bacterium]
MQAITSITSILSALPDNLQLFNTDILNAEDLLKLVIRFGFNLIVTLVLVRMLYYKASRRKEY